MMPRMASVTINRTDLFPNGTTVKIYPRNSFHNLGSGAPAGKSVAEGAMSSGTVELTGLTAGAEYTVYAEVSGEDRYLAVQAPALTPAASVPNLWTPGVQGLLAAAFDPVVASGTFGLTTAGTLYKVRVPVAEQIKVSNILQLLTTKGATLTAAECFIGLFAEGSRKLLANATAAETIAKWEGTNGTLITIPLVAPVVLGPGYVDVAMFYNGTTKPTFASAAASTAALINAGSSSPQQRFASADTGLTTALPATMSSSQTAAASPIWVGLT